MKKSKYLLLVAAGALALTTGCDQDELDIPQKGVISFEDFYKTDKDAESAITIVYATTQKLFSHWTHQYNYGPYFALTNWMGDDIWLGGSGTDDCVEQRQMHQFVYGYDNLDIEDAYYVLYASILKCNYVINNFTEERLGTLSATQKRCVAEARAMRAFDHMLLGIYWGTPPIVENVLTPADRPTNSESQAAVMDWVAKECDLAAADLDWRQGADDYKGAVRITKGFALAVKGKALLWKRDYAGAKAALKSVIDDGNYELVPSEKMITIGHADGKGSSEAVLEFNYDGTNLTGEYERTERGGWNDHSTFTWRGDYVNNASLKDSTIFAGGWGWLNPSQGFAEALIDNDGLESARRKAWIKTYKEMLYDLKWASDGDNFTPGETADKAKDKKRGISHDIYANAGYFTYKINAHPNQGDQLDDGHLNRNASIMRYAEVLLMYAEACAQLGETSGDGLDALNAVQNRAQSKTVSSALSLEAVQKEKEFELWLEGCRFADLVRWGKTETLEKQDYYLPSYCDAINDGEAEHRGYIKEDIGNQEADLWQKTYGDALGFKKGKHELLPFPKRAMSLNSALIQNPGW